MSRREINNRVSWEDAQGMVAYVADALSLAREDDDKPVGALAKPVEKVLAQWDELDGERRAKRRAVGRAHALVRRRDLQADAVVTAVHHDALGHVKQDREAALFARLFPDPLSTVVRLALASQLPVMRALALALADDETPAALKKAHGKALAEAIARGEAAILGREEAFSAAGRTSARLTSWREDANHVLRSVEGALQQIASERRLDAGWVDAYFPSVEGKNKKKKKAAKGGASGAETESPA